MMDNLIVNAKYFPLNLALVIFEFITLRHAFPDQDT